MDEVAAEFGGDFNAGDAECTEKRAGPRCGVIAWGKGV